MALGFKGWLDTPWRDVAVNDRVRTKDGREWLVRQSWNGERVMLAPQISEGALSRRYGPVIPVPLTNGDKVVARFGPLSRDGKPVELFEGLAEVLGRHPYRSGNGGCWWGDCTAPESDPVHATDEGHEVAVQPDGHLLEALEAGEREADGPRPKFGRPRPTEEQEDRDQGYADALGIDDPILAREIADGPTWGAPDPMTGTRSGMMPVPKLAEHVPIKAADVGVPIPDTDRPKFGQPTDTRTAAETLRGVDADDEGRAVRALADGLGAELVAVELAGGDVLVPRELDDLALRSHLFLMHRKFYNSQDVERIDMERDHRADHDGNDCGHRHVDRAELTQ
jgi:hypothetical protein